ncbi:MAG: hypothetical protein K0U41_08145 [Gammaproteobacteria bacterium]|nr:hypothetical protein [Gammaproteobacteria bacterium]
MAKDFLYLVQSRASVAEKHLSLETPRSDVLIYTFDRQIERPGFLFRANTTWAEGRNILIEAARKLQHSYKYYVLLDDDIKFIKGTYAQFEEEVLKVKPGLATSVYYSHHNSRMYSKITPFPYSEIIQIDCCFVCLSRDLFFGRGAKNGLDKALLPYETGFYNKHKPDTSIHSSVWFWASLFEYYSHKKLLVINKCQYINEQHIANYDRSFFFDKLFHSMKSKDPQFSNRLSIQSIEFKLRSMEGRARIKHPQIIKIIERRILKLPPKQRSSNPHYNKQSRNLFLIKQLVAQRQYSYIFKLRKARIYYNWINKYTFYRRYSRVCSYTIALWRDLKLNLRILFEKHAKSGLD